MIELEGTVTGAPSRVDDSVKAGVKNANEVEAVTKVYVCMMIECMMIDSRKRLGRRL